MRQRGPDQVDVASEALQETVSFFEGEDRIGPPPLFRRAIGAAREHRSAPASSWAEGAALLVHLPVGGRAQRLRCGRLNSALKVAHLLMSLYTYRWHFALSSMESILGVTAGANVRDALSRAMTTGLADGQLVGDALGASPELLGLAEDCHASEVAFKHGDVLVSMVLVEPSDDLSSVILRDSRRAEESRRI